MGDRGWRLFFGWENGGSWGLGNWEMLGTSIFSNLFFFLLWNNEKCSGGSFWYKFLMLNPTKFLLVRFFCLSSLDCHNYYSYYILFNYYFNFIIVNCYYQLNLKKNSRSYSFVKNFLFSTWHIHDSNK